MKKINIIIVFCFLNSISFAQKMDIDALRKSYHKAHADSASCAKLYQSLSKINSSDNIIKCYKGAVNASLANFAKNKQEKLKLFSTGKKLIEETIKVDSTNIELRFLRLTIQSNCPKILGYHTNINSDKHYIATHLESTNNTVLKNDIKTFLSETEKK